MDGGGGDGPMVSYERSFNTPIVNSTLLPLLLISLAAQKHTPKSVTSIPRHSHFDYIVVGAGSAGSVVASRLSEIPCVSVLLIEAGDSPPRTTELPLIYDSFAFSNITWTWGTVPQKTSAKGLLHGVVPIYTGKAVGGSGVVDQMIFVRGNSKEYDRWEQEGAKGWAYNDVLPFFKKLEKTHPDFDKDYHGFCGPIHSEFPPYNSAFREAVLKAATIRGYPFIDANGASQKGFNHFTANMHIGQRYSSAKAYLVPVENRDNLVILKEGYVAKILVKRGRAVGVRMYHDSIRHDILANREVILSAGALKSPQILMLSGIGPKEHLEKLKIKTLIDLPVGDNLQDHGESAINYEVNIGVTNPSDRAKDVNNIFKYLWTRTGILASPGAVTNMAFLNNGEFDPEAPTDHGIYFEEKPVVYKNSVGHNDVVSYHDYMEQFTNTSIVSCVSLGLRPRSRGTVRLKSPNPFHPTNVDPNYYHDPADLHDVIEGLKHCDEIFSSEPLKKLGAKLLEPPYPGCKQHFGNNEKYFECMAKLFIASRYHYAGTCRMGDPSNSRTVVDSELKVLHIDSLRVVDASVMPIIPSGNIQIPVIMLAEKAADIIRKDITCSGQEVANNSDDDDDGDDDNKESNHGDDDENHAESHHRDHSNKPESNHVDDANKPESNHIDDASKPESNHIDDNA